MGINGKTRLALVAGATVLVGASVAFADLSPRQREFAKREDGYFNQELATTNEKCGTKIEAKIDWESFKEEIDKSLDGKQGSSLTMWVDWEAANYSDYIKEYLNKVL
jgi:hypothetical protein